ncbi:hypothetical protein L1887_32107 [Cichorium endivia]|nr:hypothetical protein L1887_32107 [Cichorium endivia]
MEKEKRNDHLVLNEVNLIQRSCYSDGIDTGTIFKAPAGFDEYLTRTAASSLGQFWCPLDFFICAQHKKRSEG